jgi:hypothetical protein
MHVVIDRKNPLEYFDEDFYDFIHKAIEKQVLVENPDMKSLKEGSNKVGGMIYEDLLVNDENLKHIWIEYDANVLKKGIILIQVVDLIIYDEIPDLVLDRINKLKGAGATVSSKTQE